MRGHLGPQLVYKSPPRRPCTSTCTIEFHLPRFGNQQGPLSGINRSHNYRTNEHEKQPLGNAPYALTKNNIGQKELYITSNGKSCLNCFLLENGKWHLIADFRHAWKVRSTPTVLGPPNGSQLLGKTLAEKRSAFV